MASQNDRPSLSSTADSERQCSLETAIESASQFVNKEREVLHQYVDTIQVPKISTALMEGTSLIPEDAWRSMSLTDRMQHFVQDNITAASIGATFGAAVTTGITVGLVAATSMIQHVPTLYQYMMRRFHRWQRRLTDDREEGAETAESRQIGDPSASSSSSLLFLQVSVPTGPNVVQSCFTKLGNKIQSASVRRIVAYVVDSAEIHSNEIRRVMEAAPFSSANTAMTIVYVVRLEDPTHVLMLDVIAS